MIRIQRSLLYSSLMLNKISRKRDETWVLVITILFLKIKVSRGQESVLYSAHAIEHAK